MCAPAIVLAPMVASLGIKAVGSIVGTHSARSQAQRAQDANNQAVASNRTASVENTQRALQDLDARELQDMLEAAQQTDQITRQAQKLSSTAAVSAGESGVAGRSVDELLEDVNAMAARNRTTVQTNLAMSQAQLQRNREQTLANGQAQYNSVAPVKINKPNYLASVLGIASSAVDVADYAQTRNPPQTKIAPSGTGYSNPLLSNTTEYDDGM